ncbi:MAG TPA: hypothetical protein VEU08_21235, partial [Vicinamibacterales bacterium]|nr:hypothetical protein [Vicinamibacterales bacterium]
FTVDVHLSTILAAVPIMAAFVWRELAEGRWKRGAEIARAFVEIVALFEIPYVLDQMFRPSVEIRPVLLTGYIGSLHPLTGIWLALHQVTGFFGVPVNTITLTLAAVLLSAAVLAARHDALLLSVTLGPIAAMAAMLSVWQGRFFDYWLLTLVPPAVLVAAVAIQSIPVSRAREIAAAAFLVAVLAVIPNRVAASRGIERMPGYGALVRGSQQIRRRTASIARIDVAFDIGRSNSEYIYERVLGGVVNPAAPYIAEIGATGDVTYSTNPNAPGAPPRDR